MIGVPSGAQVWLAAGITDMRRGVTALSPLVQTALVEHPSGRHVFVFCGWRGDLITVLWWRGDGLGLFAKHRLRGTFFWPPAENWTASPQTEAAAA